MEKSTSAPPPSVIEFARRFAQLKQSMGGLCPRLKEFLMNEKHERVQLVDRLGFVIDGAHVYSALTPQLRAHFWPDVDELYEQQHLQKKVPPPSGEGGKGGGGGVTKFPAKIKSKVKCKFYGAHHGKIVHQELAEFVSKYERLASLPPGERPIMTATLDPCTVNVIREFIKYGILPVIAELPVWDEQMYLATAIDLIAQRWNPETNVTEVWLIELKTSQGEEVYDELEDSPLLPAPFNDKRQSPSSRHQIQLLSQAMIIYYGYGQFAIDRMVVMHAQRKQQMVIADQLKEQWAISKFPHLRALFVQEHQQSLLAAASATVTRHNKSH